jgi:coproporphyrinogen III oxidase
MISKNSIAHQDYFIQLQDSICKAIEAADGKARFLEDKWERAEGGGGITKVMQQGNIIEKGGVNFSAVHGTVSPMMLRALELEKGEHFFASGVSIVMHPHNPLMPIIHMNVRYFEIKDYTSWYGVGIDLTPHYIVPEDATFFHNKLKAVCDTSDSSYYPKFKEWADNYFYIPHRAETRGIGGVFFDRLDVNAKNETFLKNLGESFAGIYTHFMQKNAKLPFTEDQKKWQLLRRGRYAEYNLAYDRGTRFGFESNGRAESILMSLPPVTHWDYNPDIQEGSSEAFTLAHLKKGISWISA